MNRAFHLYIVKGDCVDVYNKTRGERVVLLTLHTHFTQPTLSYCHACTLENHGQLTKLA